MQRSRTFFLLRLGRFAGNPIRSNSYEGVQSICVSGVPNLILGSRGSTCVCVAIIISNQANHPTCYRNFRDPTKRIMPLVCSPREKYSTYCSSPNCFKKLGMPRRGLFLSAYSICLYNRHCSRCRSLQGRTVTPSSLQLAACASWHGPQQHSADLRINERIRLHYCKCISHSDRDERNIKSHPPARSILFLEEQNCRVSLSLEKAGKSQFVTHHSLFSGSTLTISI